MAFIDFSETAQALSPPAPRPFTRPVGESDAFSLLEQRVLELSRHDGLETLQPPLRRSWLGRLLLGPQPPSRKLANQRLEALRRLAVEARHYGWRVRTSAIAAAKAAGFSDVQIGRVIDTRGPAPRFARRNFA